jgi:hypothetical protein
VGPIRQPHENKKADAETSAGKRSLVTSYIRAARARKDVVGIVAHALREWLHGHGLPIAEIYEVIDARIAAEIDEAVADALREIRPGND